MGIHSVALTRPPFRVFAAMYIRSFFSQGVWSPDYRQSIGFGFCITPLGEWLYRKGPERREFIRRHLGHFNGNPFMLPLVLGAVANMEVRRAAGENVAVDEILRFKKIVGPATGSSGDRLFWSNLRPFALIVGIAVSLLHGLWGPPVFIAAFNLPMVLLKLRWLNAGWRLGPKVVIEIRNQVIEYSEQVMEIAGTVLAASSVIVAAVHHTRQDIPHLPVVLGGAMVVFIVAGALFRFRQPLLRVVLIGTVAAMVFGYAAAAISG